jgi:hypothetical protein
LGWITTPSGSVTWLRTFVIAFGASDCVESEPDSLDPDVMAFAPILEGDSWEDVQARLAAEIYGPARREGVVVDEDTERVARMAHDLPREQWEALVDEEARRVSADEDDA